LILYPLLSYFGYVGIFILALWFLGTLYYFINKKRPNYNLIAGFFFLCIGYIMTDLRLFYVSIFLNEPLNRSIFNFTTCFTAFIRTTVSYLINGYYHVT
jgi:hypothetical protein